MRDLDIIKVNLVTIEQVATRMDAESAVGPLPKKIHAAVLPMKNIDKAWYVAHTLFGPYNHHPPAHDWNLESMGNTDKGEILVAPFTSICTAALDFGGTYGKIIQLIAPDDGRIAVWSGWHCEDMYVQVGQLLTMGESIGTIGTANGRWAAHLHEQIGYAKNRGLPLPTDFITATQRCEWVDCAEFYKAHGVAPELLLQKTTKDGV